MVTKPFFYVDLLNYGCEVAGFDILEYLGDIEDEDAVGEEFVANPLFAWNEVWVEKHVTWMTGFTHRPIRN